jgi:hypothetical protein
MKQLMSYVRISLLALAVAAAAAIFVSPSLAAGRPDDRAGVRGDASLAYVPDVIDRFLAARRDGTSQGLKAEGLRLQGIARVYEQMQQRPAASFYSSQALRADGQRWQALAEAYRPEQARKVVLSRPAGFDWDDAGIGAAMLAALLACAACGFALVRRNGRKTAPVSGV